MRYSFKLITIVGLGMMLGGNGLWGLLYDPQVLNSYVEEKKAEIKRLGTQYLNKMGPLSESIQAKWKTLGKMTQNELDTEGKRLLGFLKEADKQLDQITTYSKALENGGDGSSQEAEIGVAKTKVQIFLGKYKYGYSKFEKKVDAAYAAAAQPKTASKTSSTTQQTTTNQATVGRDTIDAEYYYNAYIQHQNYLYNDGLEPWVKGRSTLEVDLDKLKNKIDLMLTSLSKLKNFSRATSSDAAYNEEKAKFIKLKDEYTPLYNSFNRALDQLAAQPQKSTQATVSRQSVDIEGYLKIYQQHDTYLKSLNLSSYGFGHLQPQLVVLKEKVSKALGLLRELKNFSSDPSKNAQYNKKSSEFFSLNSEYGGLYNTFTGQLYGR